MDRSSRSRPSPALTAAGMLWLGLFPLASGLTYTSITRAKWIAMWIGAALTLAAWIHALTERAPRPAPRRWGFEASVAAFLGAMGLAAVFGAWAGARDAGGVLLALSGSETRYEALPAFLAYGTIGLCMAARPVRLRWISAAAAAGLGIFCALTAWQYTGANPLGFYPANRSILTNYEFQGTIGNIDMIAVYLSLAVPLTAAPWVLRGGAGRGLCAGAGLLGVLLALCIGVQAGCLALLAMAAGFVCLALARPALRGRACALLAGVCAMALLRRCLCLPWLHEAGALALRLPSDSLSAAFAAGAALLAALAAVFRLRPGPAVPARWIVLLAALVLALAVAAAALLPVPGQAGTLWEVHELLNGRARDAFGSERVGIWRAALAIVRDHPLFGAGPGAFRRAARDTLAAEGIALRQTFDTAHSVWLDTAAAGGLPALAAFLAVLAAALRRCLRAGDEGLVLALCLVSWAAQACFTFSICLVSPMAWAVIGMGAGMARGPAEQPCRDHQPI